MASNSPRVDTVRTVSSIIDARVVVATDPTDVKKEDGLNGPGGIENKGYEHMLEQQPLSAIDDKGKEEEVLSAKEEAERGADLQYAVDDTPPWYTTVILGLQHFLLMFSGLLAIPLILAGPLCVHSAEALTRLIGTIFFVSGMVTLLQSTFGVRLPIVQGGTFSFLLPTFAILDVRGPCIPYNPANATIVEEMEADEFWQSRMREIQGVIIIASFVQMLLGCTGAIGLLLRFIGPLTIAPTIGLIGLTLFKVAEVHMSTHWGIGFFTFGLITIFSQLLNRVQIPLPGGKSFPVFMLFRRSLVVHPGIIISIVIVWIFCGILTACGVFPDDPNAYGYQARTDIKMDALKESPWFIFPYPGQWGLPTATLAGFLGMTAGVMASVVESIGDYYACARLSGSPPPPPHAVNRGIFMEGFGCLLAGLWGTGNGTTSYSENIGAIGLTKVGSRVVVQACAVFLMLVGIFGKLNALFSTIPEPVVGGVLAVTFGMVCAVGFSNLQFVDLNSSRNLFILGVSLYLGIAIPDYVKNNEGAIDTKSEQLNQILMVLLSTNMFVGGATGMILDNVIQGTDEERGIVKWIRAVGDDPDNADQNSRYSPIYNLPYLTNRLSKWRWTRFVPISPTFRGFRPKWRRKSSKNNNGSI